jgi:hypothetical protein
MHSPGVFWNPRKSALLLRRITEHLRAQNWTAIIIDFAIVVVGVFIGLQVSNWHEERQDYSRTQNHYKRLLDDFESERRALVARLDYLAVTGKYGRSALAAFSDPAKLHSSKFLIDAYQAGQIWTYAVQRATYDEILSSGIADAIPDFDLRTQLANWRRSLWARSPTYQRNSSQRQLSRGKRTALSSNSGVPVERINSKKSPTFDHATSA